MTTNEYLQLALAEMQKAQWDPHKWAEAIQNGYPPGKDYNYPVTANYKAQQYLWLAAHPPPPPPLPPSPGGPSGAKYVVFAAQEPQSGLGKFPVHYGVAFSADMAYRYSDLAARIKAFKDRGHRVMGWCDCRVDGGTPAAVGAQFVHDYGLDYFIGQAESAAEFDNAMSVGAKIVVGNITSLRQDQINKIMAEGIGFIQEDYWNEGWARAQHPAITAYCAGIYKALWEPLIVDYKNANRWREGDGLYASAYVKDWISLT